MKTEKYYLTKGDLQTLEHEGVIDIFTDDDRHIQLVYEEIEE